MIFKDISAERIVAHFDKCLRRLAHENKENIAEILLVVMEIIIEAGIILSRNEIGFICLTPARHISRRAKVMVFRYFIGEAIRLTPFRASMMYYDILIATRFSARRCIMRCLMLFLLLFIFNIFSGQREMQQ